MPPQLPSSERESGLYLEAHWLLDVVGGFLLGLTYLLLLIWTAETLAARASAPRALPSS